MLRKSQATAACLLVAALTCSAQTGRLSNEEIEKRNAAAGFVFVRDASLGVLLLECRNLLPEGPAAVEMQAREWRLRNQNDIDAAFVWVDQYMAQLKASNPAQAQAVSLEVVKVIDQGVKGNVQTLFRRQAPTADSCAYAMKMYTTPHLDIQKIASNPGYEQFGEFAQTLRRIRTESGFQVPPHLKLGFNGYPDARPLASLDAAAAARERGDGQAMKTIYTRLAGQGDGASAQTLGVLYLNGGPVEKNELLAFRWFYAAWSLGEYEGLNAMGILLGNGEGVTRNPQLAYASFLLASATARTPSLRARAEAGLQRASEKVSQVDREVLACTTLRGLDDALSQASGSPPLVKGRNLTQADRQLGQILKPLAAAMPVGGCK
jgi:hypothetical protein